MIEDFYVPEDLDEARHLADLLTPARTKALMVLRDGPARYSNHTSYAGPTVYWQSADWLSQRGLVTIGDGKSPWPR